MSDEILWNLVALRLFDRPMSAELDNTRHKFLQRIKLPITQNIYPWWRHQMETCSALLAFVRGIHRSSVNSPQKVQWRGALMFSLIYAWINGWINDHETGDLICHRAHYDVTVMIDANILYAYWKMHHIYITSHELGSTLIPFIDLSIDFGWNMHIYDSNIMLGTTGLESIHSIEIFICSDCNLKICIFTKPICLRYATFTAYRRWWSSEPLVP